MLFKEYIQNLSKKQTLQLYTLIAIFVIYPYIKIISNETEDITTDQNLYKLKNNISKIDKKIIPPNFIDVVKDFEYEAKKYKSLGAIDFKFNKKHITIQGISTQNDLLRYLLYCENYSFTSRLYSLSFKPLENSELINFSFDIEFKNTYSKKLSSNKLLKEYEKISQLDNKTKKKDFILQGIIDEFVILDNKILSRGDYFGKYKIEKINKNNIILIDNNIKKVLYIKENNNE